jgi:hypothetical protein
MTTHKTGTREEWMAARLALLQERRTDAPERRPGPAAAGAAVGPDREGYRFDTDRGPPR